LASSIAVVNTLLVMKLSSTATMIRLYIFLLLIQKVVGQPEQYHSLRMMGTPTAI
jgi:hypothetical protein